MRQDKQTQENSTDQNRSDSGREFEKHVSGDIRERMKGEHSLQVDQSGESFRGTEETQKNNTVEQQRPQQQQG